VELLSGNRLSEKFKSKMFAQAKECNYNLGSLDEMDVKCNTIHNNAMSLAKANNHLIMLLNKEYRSKESVDIINKFDYLLTNASKLGLSSCERFMMDLYESDDKLIKMVIPEVKRMEEYYTIVVNHYDNSFSNKMVNDDQIQIIMDEINEVYGGLNHPIDIKDIQCSENIKLDKVINLVKFFEDHGEDMIENFQNHIGLNEDYMSVNFSTNGTWYNIGQYNDDGYGRTILQEIIGPDVESPDVKRIIIHGEHIEVNTEIRRGVNKKVNLLM
jgi:hypothetical protein